MLNMGKLTMCLFSRCPLYPWVSYTDQSTIAGLTYQNTPTSTCSNHVTLCQYLSVQELWGHKVKVLFFDPKTNTRPMIVLLHESPWHAGQNAPLCTPAAAASFPLITSYYWEPFRHLTNMQQCRRWNLIAKRDHSWRLCTLDLVRNLEGWFKPSILYSRPILCGHLPQHSIQSLLHMANLPWRGSTVRII